MVDVTLINQLAIGNDGHQIEMDFTFAVFLHAFLNDWTDNIQPVLIRTDRSQINRTLLQTIQFVQSSIDWQITNEMEHILVFASFFVVQLEQGLPGEGIVNGANGCSIAQCEPLVEWIEWLTKFFEFGQGAAQRQIRMPAVQQNTQDGLGGASIVDDLKQAINAYAWNMYLRSGYFFSNYLFGEENFVSATILHYRASRLIFLDVFKQEYKTENWAENVKSEVKYT